MKKIVDGEEVEMSEEEIAEFEASRVVEIAVPQVLSRRQAKTFMELREVAPGVYLWDAALAAAQAITDRTTRIKTLNLLLESQVYERQRPELIDLAHSLGLTDEDLDQFFIEADTL